MYLTLSSMLSKHMHLTVLSHTTFELQCMPDVYVMHIVIHMVD